MNAKPEAPTELFDGHSWTLLEHKDYGYGDYQQWEAFDGFTLERYPNRSEVRCYGNGDIV